LRSYAMDTYLQGSLKRQGETNPGHLRNYAYLVTKNL